MRVGGLCDQRRRLRYRPLSRSTTKLLSWVSLGRRSAYRSLTRALTHIIDTVLIGAHGGHVRVTGSVALSGVVNGRVLVETEVGSLCLDENLPVTIVNPELSEDGGVGELAQAVGLLRDS